MATYKKHCIYCSKLIPGDAQSCPYCAHEDPFCMRCPRCRNPVEKGWKVCSGCGLQLISVCTACGKETPTAKTCAHCGAPVLVQCPNRKCGEVQILMLGGNCVACGKPLLNRRK